MVLFCPVELLLTFSLLKSKFNFYEVEVERQMKLSLDIKNDYDRMFAGRYIQRVLEQDQTLKLSDKTLQVMTEKAEFMPAQRLSLRQSFEHAKDDSEDINGSVSNYNYKACELLAEIVEKHCNTEERIRISKARNAYIAKIQGRTARKLDVTFDTVNVARCIASDIEKRLGKDSRVNQKQLVEYAICNFGEHIANIDDNRLRLLCEKIREGHTYRYLLDEDE